MSSLFAALSALAYGAADYAGGHATRFRTVRIVLLVSQSVGLAGIVLVIVVGRQAIPDVRDLVWGAAAGLAGVLGLATLYRGLARGAAAIVSPTAALVGTAAPILAGVLLGEEPALASWIGIGLALPAIGLLSLAKDRHRRLDALSLAAGVLAGLGFGAFFILIDQTAADSGFWPLAASRVASLTVVAFAGLLRPRARRSAQPLQPDRGRIPGTAIVAGVLDMAANVFFLLAARTGLLITSAVISSLYPAPTVLLARVLDRQRLGPRRLAGFVLALAAGALMVV